jgi:hypothetical protein
MKLVALLLPLALGLSACAQTNTVSGINACERAPADRQAVWRMVDPSVVSTGDPIMTVKKPVATGCVQPQDDKGNAPPTRDLQKVG